MDKNDRDFTIYQFKNDGTLIEYYNITSSGYYADTYAYTYKDSKIRIVDEWEDVYVYEVELLTSSKLVLFDVEYEEEIVYVRYNGSLPSGTQHNGGNDDGDDWTDDGGDDDKGDTTTPSTPSLSVPTGVQASETNGVVSITWKSVNGASSYSVWRCSTSTGSFAYLTTVSGTSATDYSPLTGYKLL